MSSRIPPYLAADEEPISDDTIDATPDGQPLPWSITDKADAEWALAKVAELAAAETEIQTQYETYVERLDRWATKESASFRYRRGRLESELIRYAEQLRDEDPKRNKTLSLPSGQVRSRSTKPAIQVVDNDSVAEWLRHHDPVLYEKAVTARVKVSELRDAVKVVDADGSLLAASADGEQVPGVTVREGGVTWTVTPTKDET